jgi:hypothetical protein
MFDFNHIPRLTRGVLIGLTVLFICLVARPNGLAPANETPPPVTGTADTLSVDYARACLRLAEAELAEAREQNIRVENSVTAYDLKRLQLHVRSAKQNVSFAEQDADASHSVLGHIELQARLSEWDLKSAETLRKQKGDAISETQLERLRSYAVVCRLRMELARNHVGTLQLFDHLHWETHRLNEEMLLLNRRVERLEATTR